MAFKPRVNYFFLETILNSSEQLIIYNWESKAVILANLICELGAI